MPRKGKSWKSKDDVACYVRLALPITENYAALKKSLTCPCFVQLNMINIRSLPIFVSRKRFDMPSLSELEIPAPISDDDNDDAVELPRLNHFTATVEGPGPEWLDSLDDESQMLVCALLAGDANEFFHWLLKFKRAFTSARINACVKVILLLPIERVSTIFKIGLESEKYSKFMDILSSILVNFIIYLVQLDEHSSKITFLLSIIRKYDLNLWNHQIVYVTKEIQMWSAFLLIIKLFVLDGDFATACDILLKNYSTVCETVETNQRRIWMETYAKELSDFLYSVYAKNKLGLTRKLISFNLNLENLPLLSEQWTAYGLATLISSAHTDGRHLTDLITEIISKNILIPEILLRATTVCLKDIDCDKAFQVFEHAETYKIVTQPLSTSRGPLKPLMALKFHDNWRIAELQLAFQWACEKIRIRKSDAKCNMLIHLVATPENFQEKCALPYSHLLPPEEPSAVKRLDRALRSMDPPVTAQVDFETAFIYIGNCHLQNYLQSVSC